MPWSRKGCCAICIAYSVHDWHHIHRVRIHTYTEYIHAHLRPANDEADKLFKSGRSVHRDLFKHIDPRERIFVREFYTPESRPNGKTGSEVSSNGSHDSLSHHVCQQDTKDGLCVWKFSRSLCVVDLFSAIGCPR
jgi:hypothetical protein